MRAAHIRAGRRAQTSATLLCCQDCNPDHGLSKRMRRAPKAHCTLAELSCFAPAHAAAKHTCAGRAAPIGCGAEKIKLGALFGAHKTWCSRRRTPTSELEALHGAAARQPLVSCSSVGWYQQRLPVTVDYGCKACRQANDQLTW